MDLVVGLLCQINIYKDVLSAFSNFILFQNTRNSQHALTFSHRAITRLTFVVMSEKSQQV